MKKKIVALLTCFSLMGFTATAHAGFGFDGFATLGALIYKAVDKYNQQFVKHTHDEKQLIKQWNAKVKAEPNNINVYLGRGVALYGMKEYKKAAKDFEFAKARGNKLAFVCCGIAYNDLGQYALAEENYTQALAMDIEGITNGNITKSDLMHDLFFIHVKRQNWSAGINDLHQLLAMDPAKYDTGFTYRQMGACYFEQGNYGGAVKCFDTAIAKSPTNGDYYGCRAESYKRLGYYQNWLEDLNMAVQYEPDNYENFTDRAEANLHFGNSRAAYYDLSSALRLKPNMMELYVKRAYLLDSMGEYDLARNDFRVAYNNQAIDDVPERYKEYYYETYFTCPTHGGRLKFGGCTVVENVGTQYVKDSTGHEYAKAITRECGRLEQRSEKKWRI